VPMHARVVRFTDVSAERIDQIVASVDESDGPPPGVDSSETPGTRASVDLCEVKAEATMD
jgi:hypothetical protein